MPQQMPCMQAAGKEASAARTASDKAVAALNALLASLQPPPPHLREGSQAETGDAGVAGDEPASDDGVDMQAASSQRQVADSDADAPEEGQQHPGSQLSEADRAQVAEAQEAAGAAEAALQQSEERAAAAGEGVG